MAWYKTGTLSIAANSKKVTGHGTRWADNKQGIGPGQMLLLPGTGAVALYEIANVVSDSELLLVSGPSKAVKEASYAIVTYNGGSYVDFGRELSAQLRYYQRQMDGWQHIMTGEGEVTLEAPDGTQVTLSSFKKLTADVASKVDKSALDAKADKSELEKKADKSELEGKATRGANSDITHLKGIAEGLSIEKTNATNGIAINITGNNETEVSFGVENVNGGSAVLHNYVKGRKGAATEDGTLIGGYGSRPWTGNNYTEHSNAALHFIQSGPCSNSNHGGYLRIVATLRGRTIDKRVDVASFNGFGDVWIAPSGRYQFTYGSANWRGQEGRGLFIAREGNAAEVQLISAKNNAVSQSIFRGICHGGTMAAPTATPDGASTFLVLAGHNGEGFEVAKAGVELRSAGNWNTSATPTCIYFSTCGTGERARNNRWRITEKGDFLPVGNNAYTLGNQENRLSAIYAAKGSIQTSDAREKTVVRGFSENEIAAAKALAKEVGFYRWMEKYKTEGETAREHCGMTVQRAIEIMSQHKLNPLHYGFICHDSWDKKEVITHYDEFDQPVMEKRDAGDCYSFRHDQLALFIARGLEARLAALEVSMPAAQDAAE